MLPIKKKTMTRCLGVATMAATLALTAPLQAAENEVKEALPDTMLWTSYGVGSAGYAEASAIANALVEQYGTRVRISPSGSAIARLQPVVSGRAQFGFLATEAFFSSEGIYDFADRDQWGPQDLRALAGRPSAFGLVVAKDTGIRSIHDVAGQRVAYVAGNPSVNVKCDAILAYAGLTRDDVDAVLFPTYSAAMSSLAQGKADATCTTTTPSQMYELAESPHGIYWVDIPADNEQGWQQIHEVAPFFKPYTETKGAGLSEQQPAHLLAYRYPILVTRADTSADEVYAFMKALDETFDSYKGATAVMGRWALDEAGTPPIGVPFHEGAIRYLKEIGVWNDQSQAWQDARLARMKAIQAAWKEALADGKDLDDEQFAALWNKYRGQALADL